MSTSAQPRGHEQHLLCVVVARAARVEAFHGALEALERPGGALPFVVHCPAVAAHFAAAAAAAAALGPQQKALEGS